MNDKIKVLKIIKDKKARRISDINLDILLSQSPQNIRTILESNGEKQWGLIKLFSSAIFYYADKEYQQQVIEVLTDKEIAEVDTPIIVKRALTDTIMKRKDGIKFLQAVKGFTKGNRTIEGTFHMLDNKYLIEREDALELFKLLGETARASARIELILKSLENKELAQLPNLKELLAPILSSNVNIYGLTRMLVRIYQNENALQYITETANSQHSIQDSVATSLIMNKRIRNHKNGVKFTQICRRAKGVSQASQIFEALENDKILNDENSPKYMEIMASSEGEREAILIRKLLEEREEGNLATLSEKEFTEIIKKIAYDINAQNCKDEYCDYNTLEMRICKYTERLIFTFFHNKKEREEGLFEYATELLDILITTKYDLISYTYNAILSIDRKQENKIDFVEAISTSKTDTSARYANTLLTNPVFMQDKNALRYIQLLTRIEEKKAPYMYEIMSKEELRKKEDGYEFIEEISKSRDIDSVDMLVEEYPEIPLSLLKAITQAAYPVSDCCNQIIMNQRIKNPLLLVREIAKIEDDEKAMAITDSIMGLAEVEELMKRENPEMILLPVATAQSEDHRNYLTEFLHNKEMLQKDNLVELETKLASCKKEELGAEYSNLTGESVSVSSAYQPIPTSSSLSRLITFLTQESDQEEAISRMVESAPKTMKRGNSWWKSIWRKN